MFDEQKMLKASAMEPEEYCRYLGFTGNPVDMEFRYPGKPTVFTMHLPFSFLASQIHKGHTVGFKDQ